MEVGRGSGGGGEGVVEGGEGEGGRWWELRGGDEGWGLGDCCKTTTGSSGSGSDSVTTFNPKMCAYV